MVDERILDSITSPAHLKLLTEDELGILANEIREEIIRVTAQNGGHVASSLGAVEIILAVHSLIDSPTDHFLFDVGHQSYAHMLVTGRLEEFETLRQYQGLSGFPKPHVNVHDVYPSGHASDSLSVACGLARARDLNGSHEKIVTLIGDASIAGGMAFEALNDIGQAQTPMVIILNDNEMAISRNVGALAKHLGDVRMSSEYRNSRDSVQDFIERQKNPAGIAMLRLGKSAKDSLKQFMLPESSIFEQLGIICTPPVDGHNIPLLRRMIKSALNANAPVLVHVVTKKGAGYAPAENEPSKFHGIGPYDKETGQAIKKASAPLTFTQVFSEALAHEMRNDDNIVAITAAMKDGTGLTPLAQEFPHRIFDVGIAEAHAMGMASGLALGGKKPVIALYSTFFQRALDQTIIDVALANANVVIAIDRAGLVGDDGPTHHGMFNLALLRMIPRMRILVPSNEEELVQSLHTALTLDGPVAICYPRGSAPGLPLPEETSVLPEGKAKKLSSGEDVAILAFGRMVSIAEDAARKLNEEHGLKTSVYDMRWAKPLDAEAIIDAAQTKLMVTLEDGVITGGVGEEILRAVNDLDLHTKVTMLGLPDAFVEQGNVNMLFADIGIDADGVVRHVLAELNETF